jgi:serine/threonine-protein kinase
MVFEVIRREDGARLALKVLRETEPNKQARLAREAQIAADVQHPNIIRVVDVGVAARIGVFVVMELIRGRSLEQYRRSYGDLDFSLDILKQVLRGLAALHRSGIAHRDLKPANVLLDGASPPLVKVTDFGVSGLVGVPGLAETLSADSDRLTVAGMVLGTPRYMAPEQIDLSQSGVAADLFSFGIMATEVLTGTYPFDEPPVMALHHLRDLPKVLPVHDRLPAALRAVLVACLAESPDERPDAEQVLAVLDGLMEAKAGTAGG